MLNFNSVRKTYFSFFLLLLLVMAQVSVAQKSENFQKDTVNKIDKNGLKQGFWVIYEKEKKEKGQIIEEGFYSDNKKTGDWKHFHNSGKIKSELHFVKGQINGKAKFYNKEGRLTEEGFFVDNNFVGEYFAYDTKGNKSARKAIPLYERKNSYLEFSGIVQKLGKEVGDVKIIVEKNDIVFSESISDKNGYFNIKLPLNNDFIVYFDKYRFNKLSMIVNTNVVSLTDTSIYYLKDWKVNLSDNIATATTNEIISLILNKPAGRIYFNKKKKKFDSDGQYVHFFKREAKRISETTKSMVSSVMEDNQRLEIANLKMDAENKEKELILLKQAKELQDAELQKRELDLKQQNLETEKKEQGLVLLEKERQIQNLKYEQQKSLLLKQQLEAEKKVLELEKLSNEKKSKELELEANRNQLSVTSSKLNKTTNALYKRAREASVTQKEISVLSREKDVKERELKQSKNFISYISMGLAVILIFSILLFRNILQKKKAHSLLELKTVEIASQKKVIEEKNKDITDSINYSKRIQEAILPSRELKKKLFHNAFVLFKPKDIVSGDFYWFSEKNGTRLIAACDCTGHGVPGALMSMVGNNTLNQIVNERGIIEPNEILNNLDKEVRKALKQGENTNSKDGMDVALITFKSPNEISYAGAHRPLWIIRGNTLEEIKANKISIGGHQSDEEVNFTNHNIKLSKGDSVYIFSDGFADQFGGEGKKKLMTKNFKKLLQSIQHLGMPEQEEHLDNAIENWKGNLEQVDDILVIGIRI